MGLVFYWGARVWRFWCGAPSRNTHFCRLVALRDPADRSQIGKSWMSIYRIQRGRIWRFVVCLPNCENAGHQFYHRCSHYMWILGWSVWCCSASARMGLVFYWGAVNWRVRCGAPSCSMHFVRKACARGVRSSVGVNGVARTTWRGRAMVVSPRGRKARHARYTTPGSEPTPAKESFGCVCLS